jgi:hypothetical protein
VRGRLGYVVGHGEIDGADDGIDIGTVVDHDDPDVIDDVFDPFDVVDHIDHQSSGGVGRGQRPRSRRPGAADVL